MSKSQLLKRKWIEVLTRNVRRRERVRLRAGGSEMPIIFMPRKGEKALISIILMILGTKEHRA